MPNYKMVDADALDGAMLATAEAIRTKGGTEELIAWNKSTGYKEAIDAITAGGASGIPNYTYSGNATLHVEDEENWHIKLLTSGIISFDRLVTLDVFLVGGGACGGYQGGQPGMGGGAGYTKTGRGIAAIKDQQFEIVIGAGGAAPVKDSDGGGDGGETSGFGLRAAGGLRGASLKGGNGGSGGAGYGGTTGGVDGGNGAGDNRYAGVGQGTTTRAFEEADGELYATGGDFGSYTSSDIRYGAENTGDGGSGSTTSTGYAGGSGIVIIRNAREAT